MPADHKMNDNRDFTMSHEQEEEQMRRAIELSKQDALKFVKTKSMEHKQIKK